MYSYSKVRGKVFTESGQVMFLAIRDHVKRLLQEAGAVTMGAAMRGAKSGDAWVMMACVDRMVELDELREVKQAHEVAGQHRVFVAGACST